MDNLFDEILNKFYILLNNKKIFEKYSDDQNFVKYMNDIIDIIKVFIDGLNIKEIEALIGSSKHTNHIIDIIKREKQKILNKLAFFPIVNKILY